MAKLSKPARRSRAEQHLEDARQLLAWARRVAAETQELIEQSKTVIAASERLRQKPQPSQLGTETALRLGSKREMAQRHVAEQRGRIAKQQALISRALALGHPTERANYLLAEMEQLHEGMCAELKQASDDD